MVEHDSSPLKWLGTLFAGVNQPNKIKDIKGHELASRVGTTLKSKNSMDLLLLKMLAASLNSQQLSQNRSGKIWSFRTFFEG